MTRAAHVAALLLAAVAVGQEPDAARRSVILILADDLGVECLSCYGSTSYATPELDRLAAEGVRFTECHTQPLCTPTRLEILTGLHNARNYVAFSVLPPSATTFADLLHDAGYATGVFGKWQLYATDRYPEGIRRTGTLPEDAGFDTHCLWQVDELGARYWGPTLRIDGVTKTFGDDTYGPDVFTEHLLRFVEANAERPFLAYWPMALTHNPFVPPPPKPDDVRAGPQHFGAMVEYMDRLVGRVVRRVEGLGIADRTLVVFVGDNGTHRRIRSQVGERTVAGGKGSTTDAGTHVPMIAWGPGLVRAGTVRTELVSTRDLLPTLVALAGAAMPDVTDGHSLLPHLRGEDAPPRTALAFDFWPRPRTRPDSAPARFALDERFRLYEDGRMFDRFADPEETRSLDDVDPERRARLRAAIDEIPTREK